MRLSRSLAALWSRFVRPDRHRHSAVSSHRRGPITHVVILDGTMSTLEPGFETNAGLTYRLLADEGPNARLSLFYEAGVQWRDWASTGDVLLGRGVNRKIRRAYGFLASRYRPGDRIFLFGYSRGAFAVRSLAGLIDRVGLVVPRHATERNIRQAWRHYRDGGGSATAAAFRARFCHSDCQIEMIGAWDSVKAIGQRLPLLWPLIRPEPDFHDHRLGHHVRRGFHALAYDETRLAFTPELWDVPPERAGEVEQRWFPGTHGDVGGQLGGHHASRPLSNLSLVWMLEKAEAAGLVLPPDWRRRFPQDPRAPSVGTLRGMGKLFVLRARRRCGLDASETFHPAIARPALPRAAGEHPRTVGLPARFLARIGLGGRRLPIFAKSPSPGPPPSAPRET